MPFRPGLVHPGRRPAGDASVQAGAVVKRTMQKRLRAGAACKSCSERSHDRVEIQGTMEGGCEFLLHLHMVAQPPCHVAEGHKHVARGIQPEVIVED